MMTQSSPVPHWTAQFQSIMVGFGSLLAGIGGLKIMGDWLEQAKLKRKVSNLQHKYPVSDNDKTYRLVDIAEEPGRWWLLDEKESPKTRHWVRPYETVRDMGWHEEGIKPKRITKKELEKYIRKENINPREL